MHSYDIKLNGLILPCHVCRKIGQTIQHHVYGRRYSDKCIWVCDACHKRIHANPVWARDNRLMIAHNDMPVVKTSKSKKCLHKKVYVLNDYIKCQFCGKVVDFI